MCPNSVPRAPAFRSLSSQTPWFTLPDEGQKKTRRDVEPAPGMELLGLQHGKSKRNRRPPLAREGFGANEITRAIFKSCSVTTSCSGRRLGAPGALSNTTSPLLYYGGRSMDGPHNRRHPASGNQTTEGPIPADRQPGGRTCGCRWPLPRFLPYPPNPLPLRKRRRPNTIRLAIVYPRGNSGRFVNDTFTR